MHGDVWERSEEFIERAVFVLGIFETSVHFVGFTASTVRGLLFAVLSYLGHHGFKGSFWDKSVCGSRIKVSLECLLVGESISVDEFLVYRDSSDFHSVWSSVLVFNCSELFPFNMFALCHSSSCEKTSICIKAKRESILFDELSFEKVVNKIWFNVLS